MGRVTAQPAGSVLDAPAPERPLLSPGPPLPPVFGATDRLRGWVVTIVLTAIAAITRFWGLGTPTNDGFNGNTAVHTPVFDEKHYVPQAWQMLTSGRWIEDNPAYGLVVHPPVGKWMIAGGEWLFGYTPFGWRFASAVCGTLLVFLTIRSARRLSRSTLIGALAGIFLICDGLTFVSSRVGLLDIFLVTFGFAAFSMVIADRDQVRARFAKVAAEGRMDDSPFGPRMGFRWWRFGAAVCIGLACGVKWSGLYYLLGLAVLSIGFDLAARYAYRVRRPVVGTLVRDLIPTGLVLGVLPILIYLGTFWAWFASETAVFRYEVGNAVGSGGLFGWVPAALRSLAYYEDTVLQFHAGLTNSAGNHHPWESKPWTWPMGLRPMLYSYTSDQLSGMCSGGDCVRAVMAVGTPAFAWLSVPVMLWAIWKFLVKRDWAYAAVTLMYAATYLPWFTDLDRQMYYFYGLTLTPFLAIAIALICAEILGTDGRARRFTRERVMTGQFVVIVYTAIVVLNFAWLWPILTGEAISTWWWQMEMWLPSWR
ncbi:phospholipid carrier-dependent glycosyltransferase [Tsukamurella sp. 8F]|uniref:dolichyl-phosphate-mannose--protein mannosyltransferase n=1 Tax=unclassified Tsukamurella TaxID=2633480 RepID=UPI0023BA0835|nr:MULTISPECIES: phospholipid carrier-dependent glycosyltransferase [unclassified Tsukamurella]MDF0530274.1 phospholipid carrier-dependent glycosyltransferase [Tsukamurella sp. 8J]MDF0588592.1 phospholipid carrier-dependent glycosyltransferase [Tsukamurella sp. 8F]